MLTGDRIEVARQIAEQVGLDEQAVLGQVAPEQKLAQVKQAGDTPCMMVGDGVNDAAALAAAHIGVAVSGGAEASLAAADVYLARPGLAPLVELVTMGRQTMRIIHRNLAVSLGYNAVAVSLAAGGLINPLIAAILMPLSSATVLALAMGGQWGAARAVKGQSKRGPKLRRVDPDAVPPGRHLEGAVR